MALQSRDKREDLEYKNCKFIVTFIPLLSVILLLTVSCFKLNNTTFGI